MLRVFIATWTLIRTGVNATPFLSHRAMTPTREFHTSMAPVRIFIAMNFIASRDHLLVFFSKMCRLLLGQFYSYNIIESMIL